MEILQSFMATEVGHVAKVLLMETCNNLFITSVHLLPSLRGGAQLQCAERYHASN